MKGKKIRYDVVSGWKLEFEINSNTLRKIDPFFS